MANTWVTDLQHFLEHGELALDIPGPALNLALFQGAIVAWMTAMLPEGVERTNVRCRRNPQRRRCRGEIHARFDPNDTAILWECPLCGENGRISGWEGTEWDRLDPHEVPEGAGS